MIIVGWIAFILLVGFLLSRLGRKLPPPINVGKSAMRIKMLDGTFKDVRLTGYTYTVLGQKQVVTAKELADRMIGDMKRTGIVEIDYEVFKVQSVMYLGEYHWEEV